MQVTLNIICLITPDNVFLLGRKHLWLTFNADFMLMNKTSHLLKFILIQDSCLFFPSPSFTKSKQLPKQLCEKTNKHL